MFEDTGNCEDSRQSDDSQDRVDSCSVDLRMVSEGSDINVDAQAVLDVIQRCRDAKGGS